MPVTDRQVATLRALLVRDTGKYRQLFGQLGDEDEKRSLLLLSTGAFLEAVKARFSGKKRSDIVNWVAEVRAERDPNGEIDPNVAERLILWVFDKESVDDIDVKVGDAHQAMLLVLLVEEQGLDDAGLDAFLEKAREFTDKAVVGEESAPRE